VNAETGGFRDAHSVPPAAPPHRVRLPVNVHHWDNISFLHWPVAPDDIAPLLPTGLSPATYDGTSWIGVASFFIRVRPLGVPIVPPRCAFPETNLRTYVRGPDGGHGVWFIRMEVTALWFVLTLRALGLPYVQRRMSVDVHDDRIAYESGPRGGGFAGRHRIVVRPGAWLQPREGGPFERFLTARWAAYHRQGPVLLATPVQHPPWSLRAGEVETCDVDALFGAAGLPSPVGPPVCHVSPGVEVKVGPPCRVA
jgi:uncharacterized protein YqjF (DUF2071 family)